MEVNVMPWHLTYTLLGKVSLRPSDKLLKSCPFGHILECRGVASAVPLMVDKIETSLNFHIFDVLDLDLLLGYPLEKFLDRSHGSLDGNLREAASTTVVTCSYDPMARPLPKLNPLEKMTHESPFMSSEPNLFQVAEFPALEQYGSEETLHLCEDKRSSSPSTEFEPLPSGSHYVVLDHD
ncbi:unnamed protein product [Urochloa humidicola]